MPAKRQTFDWVNWNNESKRKRSSQTKYLQTRLKRVRVSKTEELLKIERYRETVGYMMEHDCKLEQEIISWSESQKSAAKIKI